MMKGSSKKSKNEEESFERLKSPRSVTSPNQNKKLNFEVILSLFSLFTFFLQTHNIFKTNFWNYDQNVLTFACLIIVLRFFVNFIFENKSIFMNNQNRKNAVLIKFMISIILCIISVVYIIFFSMKIGETYGLIHVFFSYYPIVIYILTFISYKYLKVPWRENSDSIETTRSRQLKILDNIDGFNELKSIIYRVLEMSYYSGIFPLGFISGHIYYNSRRTLIFVVYIILNSLILLFLQLIFENYPKFLFHANQFGCWLKYEPKIEQNKQELNLNSIAEWSGDNIPYQKNCLVIYQENIYISIGNKNNGAPDYYTDYLIHKYFDNPNNLLSRVTIFQSIIVMTQLIVFIFESKDWEVDFIFLLINYLILALILWVWKEVNLYRSKIQ